MIDKITNIKLYNEHIEEMFGNTHLEDYSDANIDRVLDRLIACISNDGKLYKYKSVEGETEYKNTYSSLSEGYLWIASADTLNDEFDVTINFDPERELQSFKDFIFNHPVEFIDKILSYFRKSEEYPYKHHPLEDAILKDIVSCFDKHTGKLKKKKATAMIMKKANCTLNVAKQYAKQLEDLINTAIIKNREALEEIGKNIVNINRTIRSTAVVFSLTEDCNSDKMWALYANNTGICIEYDYNKVKFLPRKTKQLFMSLYKVIYTDEKPEISFLEDFKYGMSANQDNSYIEKANKKVLPQFITKKEEWKSEKEWRILLFNINNKVFADIVSAIYVTENSVNDNKIQSIIALAESKGWSIYVKRMNAIGTRYIFEKYSDYLAKK